MSTLVDCRVCREEVVIMFSFRIPDMNTVGSLEYDWNGVVAV